MNTWLKNGNAKGAEFTSRVFRRRAEQEQAVLYQSMLSFLLIAAAVALVWVAPFEVQVAYRKEGQVHRVSVVFCLMAGRAGLSWGPYNHEWKFERQPSPMPCGALSSMDSLRVRIRELSGLLKYLPAAKQSIKQLRLGEWRWFTEIGLDDPAQTAVAAGMIWGVKGWLWAELHRRLRVESRRQPLRPVFGVHPNFERTGISIDFSCRLQGRLGAMARPWLAIAARQMVIRGRNWYKKMAGR